MLNSMSSDPASAYKNVGLETGVMAADPHKLIVMLFDGALLAIAAARAHIDKEQIPEKGQSIIKAIDIVSNGLKASLDFQAGGDLAEKLGGLYDYVCVRLLHANLHNDKAALDEASGLLAEIREAWQEMERDSRPVPENGSKA